MGQTVNAATYVAMIDSSQLSYKPWQSVNLSFMNELHIKLIFMQLHHE